MPENLYSANIQGDFNDSTIDNSGYGSLSAAEKNQTYFAYFSSVGSTTPELIDQTAYFVKYLIDAQGNVVTPQPNSIDVLNLVQNFEAGKTVNVTSLEGTTLFNSLLGSKTVTDIGRIETILTTETGSGKMDYLRTMSFYQGDISFSNVPNYSFTAKKTTTSTVTNTTWTDLPFATELSDPLGNYDPTTYTYTFNSNTYDYSTNVVFKVNVSLNGFNTGEEFYLQIIKSTDNFITSQSLDLNIIPSPPTITPPNPQSIWSDSEGAFYVAAGGAASSTYVNSIASVPQVFSNGTKVKVRYKLGPITSSPSVNILGSSTDNNIDTSFLTTTNYTNNLEITSSYWLGALNFPTSSNVIQGLIATLPFSSVLNSQNNYLQALSTASVGFNNIISLSHIQPGDYIRFEYDKTKQSKVYNVSSIPGGYVYLEISPPVPSGSILDHFTVFRINPNAGNQIILNVPKPTGTTGQPLTGFIKPQHMSKELEDNFTTIVQKLAAEGLLT
jgi:hypothetical protein